MGDVSDILGKGKTKTAKKAAPKGRKISVDKKKGPTGLQRELAALAGSWANTTDLVDIFQPADPMVGVKEKRKMKINRTQPWERKRGVRCSCNRDIETVRWVKVAQPNEETLYTMSKPTRMVQYNAAEYDQHLQDETGKWTKENTDTLFELCDRFGLRWIVIHDKFPGNEFSLEELKQRYYSCAEKLLKSRCKSEREIKHHPVITCPYSYEREALRKTMLERLFSLTEEELEEQKALRQQVKVIQKARKKIQHEQRGTKRKLMQVAETDSLDADGSPQRGQLVIPIPKSVAPKKLKPGVQLRSSLLVPQGSASGSSSIAREVANYVDDLEIEMPTEEVLKLVQEVKELYVQSTELQKETKKQEYHIGVLEKKKLALEQKIAALGP